MKKYSIVLLTSLTLVLIVTGCASIFSGGSKKFSIRSTPPDATITVYDRAGAVFPLATNTTPTVMKLHRSDGFFRGNTYRVVVQKDGYEPCEFKIRHDLNGWYFGNFVFGGLIGFIIVDPATGAMWSLKPDPSDPAMMSQQVSVDKDTHALVVMLKQKLSQAQQDRLVMLQPGRQ